MITRAEQRHQWHVLPGAAARSIWDLKSHLPSGLLVRFGTEPLIVRDYLNGLGLASSQSTVRTVNGASLDKGFAEPSHLAGPVR
jgi:hypothetical protein